MGDRRVIMKAFITVLATEDYLKGVLVLNHSLKLTKTKYPLYALTSPLISKKTKEVMKYNGIKLLDINEMVSIDNQLLEKNNESQYNRWNNTFLKLEIFNLIEFEKLVYLDADMYITNNIDELFFKEHMSAVVAGGKHPSNRGWIDLNSGLMVVKPEQGLKEKILLTINKVSKEKNYFGDQDLIQEYYKKWSLNRELRLDEKYNFFASMTSYYTKELGYNLNFNNADDKTITVIHFEERIKPWMLGKYLWFKRFMRLILYREYKSLKIYFIYFLALCKINKSIRNDME